MPGQPGHRGSIRGQGCAGRSPHARRPRRTSDQRTLFEGLPQPCEVGAPFADRPPATMPAELEVSARTAEGEIMAVAHRSLWWRGVQFHPESILTPTVHGCWQFLKVPRGVSAAEPATPGAAMALARELLQQLLERRDLSQAQAGGAARAPDRPAVAPGWRGRCSGALDQGRGGG